MYDDVSGLLIKLLVESFWSIEDDESNGFILLNIFEAVFVNESVNIFVFFGDSASSCNAWSDVYCLGDDIDKALNNTDVLAFLIKKKNSI